MESYFSIAENNNNIFSFCIYRYTKELLAMKHYPMLTIFIVMINRDILSENENNCSLTSSMVIEKRIFSKSYYDRAACLAC